MAYHGVVNHVQPCFAAPPRRENPGVCAQSPVPLLHVVPECSQAEQYGGRDKKENYGSDDTHHVVPGVLVWWERPTSHNGAVACRFRCVDPLVTR